MIELDQIQIVWGIGAGVFLLIVLLACALWARKSEKIAVIVFWAMFVVMTYPVLDPGGSGREYTVYFATLLPL